MFIASIAPLPSGLFWQRKWLCKAVPLVFVQIDISGDPLMTDMQFLLNGNYVLKTRFQNCDEINYNMTNC